MKHFILFTLILLAAGCSSSTGDEPCPEIFIPRETARLYQNNGRFDEFQINLVGTEGYCYTEPSNNRRYAVITPVFRVRRLEDSLTTSIDADFMSKPRSIPKIISERAVLCRRLQFLGIVKK